MPGEIPLHGVAPPAIGSIKGQGPPKERPESAQQVTVTKPAEPPPAPPPKEGE